MIYPIAEDGLCPLRSQWRLRATGSTATAGKNCVRGQPRPGTPSATGFLRPKNTFWQKTIVFLQVLKARWQEWKTSKDGAEPAEEALSKAPLSVRAAARLSRIQTTLQTRLYALQNKFGGIVAQLRPLLPPAPAEERGPLRYSLAWWQEERRIYRRLDPIILYLIGDVIGLADAPLGAWIAFAAICLAADENLKWRYSINAFLDWHDSQIDGLVMREWDNRPRQGRAKPRPVTETYGLPTGIGDDIRARVAAQGEKMQAQRVAERRAVREQVVGDAPRSAAPDNLEE